MSKLSLLILTTIISWSGFELSQTATATQLSTPSIAATTQFHPGIGGSRYFALARKCTLKRYRRPR